MSAQYVPGPAPRRRSPWLTVTGLNLVALAAVAVPAILILRSAGVSPELGFNLFTATAGMLMLGLAACAGVACALGRRATTSAALMLPLAASALVAAFAMLAALAF